MKPDYPIAVPTLKTLTTNDVPLAEDYNQPSRELESLARVTGKAPKTYRDLAPKQNPRDVAEILSFLTYILRTLSGKTTFPGVNAWKSMAWSQLMANVLGAGATGWVPWWRGATAAATEAETRFYVPFACNITSLRARTLNAQPGTGTLVFTVRKNGVDQAIVITVAAGGASAVNVATGSVAFNGTTDYLTVRIVNNAAGNSAQIGGITAGFEQAG